MKTIIFIALAINLSLSNLYGKGATPPKKETSSCENEGLITAASDDKESEYRTIFLPPASQYGGNTNSGQINTGGKIACQIGHICYFNQNYQFRLSTTWDKNRGCSKDSCNTEIGKTMGVKFPAGEYLAQFPISHGASNGHNLGRVKAFALVKSTKGDNCLKEISSRDIISTGPVHQNNHALENPKEPHWQYILLPFKTEGANPIILKTYWRRNEERQLCKIFNDCTWLWLGTISVNPIGQLGRPDTYKRPIWNFAHRRNNLIRLDVAFLTAEEFRYAYNPTNGAVAPLSEYTYDYYGGNKELQEANGEGANCIEFDITPVFGATKDILKDDPLYKEGNPFHKWSIHHFADMVPDDFTQPEKKTFLGLKGMGGGVHNKNLPSLKGWATLPSGSEAYFKRVTDWLKGNVKLGNRTINRKIACACLDIKFQGWPTGWPYKGREGQYAKDLISFLRNQLGWDNALFSRVIFSVSDQHNKEFRKAAESLFEGGFPGLFDGYNWGVNTRTGDLVKARTDYIKTLRENDINWMSIGHSIELGEYPISQFGAPPLDPMYLYTPFVAEMKNQMDRTGSPVGFYFYTVDLIQTISEAIDHGSVGIITNWPSRVRIMLNQYPYKYYLRNATAADPLRPPKK
jgi:hypothetical protein